MKNLTDYCFSRIFPSMEKILYSPVTSYLTNNIIHRNVVLYGKPGSGKTELVRSAAERAVGQYGLANVNAVTSHDGNLELLLESGLDDKPVQLLFADNVTLVQPGKETVQNFFKIRHYYRILTGKNNGLLVTFLGAHRFHGINISLRTDFDLLIARNSPTSPFDHNIMKKFLGEPGIALMEVLEEEREQNPGLFRFSVFSTKRYRGILEVPLANRNYLRELETYSLPPALLGGPMIGVYKERVSTAGVLGGTLP